MRRGMGVIAALWALALILAGGFLIIPNGGMPEPWAIWLPLGYFAFLILVVLASFIVMIAHVFSRHPH